MRAQGEQAIATAARQAPPAAEGAAFSEDELLLLEVQAKGASLADSLPAYATQGGVFLPLGELARVLDLAITVEIARGRAEGWVLREDRSFRLDLPARTATSGERTVSLTLMDARAHDGDIYVRAEVLQDLLPAFFKVDQRSSLLTVLPTERLPFQERLERAARRDALQAPGEREARPVLRAENPYRPFSMPALAVNIASEYGTTDARSVAELRAAGDLGYMGYQLFAGGSDLNGLDAARLTFERVDPDGLVLGINRIAMGDTVAPSLAVGPKNAFGRGVFLSAAPLETANVFDTVDLHGELPAGWEVELYIGEVLRDSTAQSVEGRFEFNDVSLTYGLNLVRLVYYGPKGERREEVRRINVSAGGLPKGRFSYRFGAVQDRKPLIDVGPGFNATRFGNVTIDPEQGGDWQVVAEAAYGLTKGITLRGGVARASDELRGDYHVGVIGASTSLAGFAAEFNLAADDLGGAAVTAGVAGQVLGGGLVLQHAEYSGGFLDEQSDFGLGAGAVRSTRLSYDTSLDLLGRTTPARLQFQRSQYTGEKVSYDLEGRLSAPLWGMIASASANLRAVRGPGGDSLDAAAAVSISGTVQDEWRVRGDIAIADQPSIAFAADRVTETGAIRFAVGHAFGKGSDTLLQLGKTWRLDTMDVGVYAGYQSGTNDARIGVTFSTGFAYDSHRRRYRRVGEGAASGGSIQVHAFHDRNADGVWTPDEPPVPNLPVSGGRMAAATDSSGRALITGLGVGPRAAVRVDAEVIEDPFVAAPPQLIVSHARAGRIAVAAYPLVTVGEFEITAVLDQAGEERKELSALDVQVVDRQGAVRAEGRTGYDGVVIFDKVPVGRYAARIQPEQAARLNMAFAEPVLIEIPPEGGFVGHFEAKVVVGKTPPQLDLASLLPAPAAGPQPPAAGPAEFSPPPIGKQAMKERKLGGVSARGPPKASAEARPVRRGWRGVLSGLGRAMRRLLWLDRPAARAEAAPAAGPS